MQRNLAIVRNFLGASYQEATQVAQAWWDPEHIAATFIGCYNAHDGDFELARSLFMLDFRLALRTKYELELVCEAFADSEYGFVREYLTRLVEPIDATLREAVRHGMRPSQRLTNKSHTLHQCIRILECVDVRWLH